jgi:hypothetical protein
VASEHEGQTAMSALCELSPTADYPEQLEGDDLEHARDGKRRLKPTGPCLSRIDVCVRHERHGRKFQPSRDALEQPLELILRTRAAVSKTERFARDGLGVA